MASAIMFGKFGTDTFSQPPWFPSTVRVMIKIWVMKCILSKYPTRMGFEPTRAEPNGLAVHRLNHSATSSHLLDFNSQGILIKTPYSSYFKFSIHFPQLVQYFFSKCEHFPFHYAPCATYVKFHSGR